MTRRTTVAAGALFALALLTPTPLLGQDKVDLHRMLETQLEVKDFTNPMTFKDALGLLHERLAAQGHEVPVIVNLWSFREEAADAVMNPYDAQVQLPAVPRTLTVGQALQQLIDHMPSGATLLLRNGAIEIISREGASQRSLLWQRPVQKFDQAPLEEALGRLSYWSGVSIVLDPRAKDKKGTLVTAEFRGDVNLESALRMLADMADLKIVLMDRGVYVTTPENAATMERELEKRRKEAQEQQDQDPRSQQRLQV